MQCVKQHAHTLHALCKSKGKRQKQILHASKPGVVRAISQCAANTLRGNISLSPLHKKRLKRHQRILRALAAKSISLKKKKKLLLQKGAGLLPLLLGPIISSIAGALFSR